MSSIDDFTAFGETPVAQFNPLASWSFTYNINPGLVKTTENGTGTVTHDVNMAKCSTGTDSDGSAKVQTVRSSRYVPGIGGRALFTAVFSEPAADSKMYIGPINDTNGWAIGYNGLNFGIVRKSLGVETWFYTAKVVNQERSIRSLLTPQKGNVFQIRYQWLGFGVQRVYFENSEGELAPMKQLFYADLYTETSIDNANLPITMEAVNDGNTSDVWVKSPSAVVGLEGDGLNDSNSVSQAADVTKAVTAVLSNVPIISFRLGETYLGKANHLFTLPTSLAIAADLNKNIIIRAYAAGALTGASWSYVNETLGPAEIDTASTAYSPGVLIGTYPLGKTDSYVVSLVPSAFRQYAGQSITLTATTAATSGDFTIGINWKQFL